MEDKPFYKFYFGLPFWSDDYIWFFITRQLSLMWLITLYLWPISMPFLPFPGPIAIYVLMIVYTQDPDLFDYKNQTDDYRWLGEMVSQFGYTLDFFYKCLVFDYENIPEYDGIVRLEDFFRI